jgi:D-alanyl-D-alanine carboxypeptidase
VSLRITVAILAAAIVGGGVAVRLDAGSDGGRGGGAPAATARAHRTPPYGTGRAPVRVAIRFKHPPRSGELFDLRTGRVLWSRNPNRRQPMASLAKMMTAVVVADRARDRERVFVSGRARAAPGSGVGLLPPGRRVPLGVLLYGMLLPSGNDAAVALAEHVGGSVERFVRLMNARARALGLRCTRFSSPDGYEDRGNRSCARDLAVLAREVLRRPRLARVVRTGYVSFPWLLPHTAKVRKRKVTVWKPGRLYLASHNPLLLDGYRGATGIKTGYTDGAGRCLVATARRGRHALGVVLLDSPDPGAQAERLLDGGFRALAPRRLARRRPARVR